MTHTVRRNATLLAVVALLGSVSAALAQIAGTPVSLPPRPSGRNSLAFDTVNQVYLVIQAGHPVSGRFMRKDGVLIGVPFLIAGTEAGFTGWASVSFGGPAGDPAFLVTYVAVEGTAHNKYGRLVRYVGGVPVVSPPSFIVPVGGEWYAGERAQSTWNGAQFVVGTRVPANPFPQPQLHMFDMAGNVWGGQWLGDFLDYYGSPALSCAPSNICLAIGYANGVPFGGTGGSYARLFHGATLQPLSAMFYVDDHSSRMEDQNVIFDSRNGRFLTAWWRADFADVRAVNTDGSMGPLRTSIGPFAGDLVLRYNSGTQTALLASKAFPADLYAYELNGDGVAIGGPVLITTWDGRWPEYTPAVAANHADRQWLVVAVQTDGGRAALIQSLAGQTSTSTRKRDRRGDYDGDGTGDIVVYRPGSGSWLIVHSSTGTGHGVGWGSWTDAPVPGDYDGDGRTDIAIYRPSNGVWYILKSRSSTASSIAWGQPGDIPVPADYDGDGKTDVAVYRPSTAAWYIIASSTNTEIGLLWGNPGDIPVPADYDGDGKADPTVWRRGTGTWYQLRSTSGGFTVVWGQEGDTPLAGDFDGDGKADPTVFRALTGAWYQLRSTTGGGFGVFWGGVGDVPIVRDFDGDGRADPTVFRPSTNMWYQLHSATGRGVAYAWGANGDLPM